MIEQVVDYCLWYLRFDVLIFVSLGAVRNIREEARFFFFLMNNYGDERYIYVAREF